MTYIKATTTQRGYVKQAADVTAMTDSSGGTASRTIAAAGAIYSQTEANDGRACFADYGNDLRTNLRTAGQMA